MAKVKMNTTTYGEKVRAVESSKVLKWKGLQKASGTFEYIAAQCFRSRATIATAINHGIATESTESNLDKFFGI